MDLDKALELLICSNITFSYSVDPSRYEIEQRWLPKLFNKVRADAIEEILEQVDKLTSYYAGDEKGNPITPIMLIKDEVIKAIKS